MTQMSSSPKMIQPSSMSPAGMASPVLEQCGRSLPLSPSLSSDSTPSLSAILSPLRMPAGFLNSNSPFQPSSVLKFSIHHQDAEVSIADATDCLRMVSGKIDWFHRKQAFCPGLISPDDALQIAALHEKILIEEVPFLELQTRLQEGLFVDIPRELEGRVQTVCGIFDELKHRIEDLVTKITPTLLGSPH